MFFAHLHIFTSSHLHIFTSSHLHIFTSSHLHIFTSLHLHIFTSSHLHIFTSSHLHIFTSSHFHIFTSSHFHILFTYSSSHHIFTYSFVSIEQGCCKLRSELFSKSYLVLVLRDLRTYPSLNLIWLNSILGDRVGEDIKITLFSSVDVLTASCVGRRIIMKLPLFVSINKHVC